LKEPDSKMADKIKLTLAALLVVAGIAGFYAMSASAMALRVLAVIAGLIAGGAVALFTAPGREFAGFARESVAETKKVVWPTRKETMQTTGVVVAFVIVMALFLWLVDAGLLLVVSLLTGRSS
jgi:preprotein translocase subunit SecE